jgi:hypothetical protein
MNYLVALTALLVLPWLVGYIYVRNDIDPDTPEGKEFYK